MTTSPFAFPAGPSGSGRGGPESLLAEHGAFLTALARAIVHDAGAADDLTQETLVEALGRGGQATRPWLVTVLRRKAANRFRSERRRSDRERAAARSEVGADSAEGAEAAEQMEVVERLFRLVRDLDEPQRDAVLGRFYRGLSYVDLGRELGVPASTAQSRVQRGLETLKVRLDEHGAQGRAAWVGALGAFAGLEPRGVAGAGGGAAMGAAAGGTTIGAMLTGARGWWAVGSWARSAAAIVALSAAGFAGYTAWSGLSSSGADSVTAASSPAVLGELPPAGSSEGSAQGLAPLAPSVGAARATSAQESPPDPGRAAIAAEVAGDADGYVLQFDGADGKVPAAGVEVHWRSSLVVAEETLDDVTGGDAAGSPSSGFFNDGDSGTVQPAEPSDVATLGGMGYLGEMGYGGGGDVKTTSGIVRTDERGAFRLDSLPEGSTCTIEVKADETYRAVRIDGLEAYAWRPLGQSIGLLRVPHGYLQGRAVDLDGLPLKGVNVSVRDSGAADGASAVSDDEGRFEFALRTKRGRVNATLTGYVQVGERDAKRLAEGGWEPRDVTLARAGTLEIDLGPAREGDLPRTVTVSESRDQTNVFSGLSRGRQHKGEADARGIVTIAGLPVGRKLVIAAGRMERIYPYRRGGTAVSVPSDYGGGAPRGTEPIVIPESGRLRLSPADLQFHTLRGRVVTEEGEGVPGELVIASAAGSAAADGIVLAGRAATDEAGAFAMGLASYGDPRPVLVRVYREMSGHSAASLVDLRAAESKEVILRFAPMEVLSGRVQLPSDDASIDEAGLRLMLVESRAEHQEESTVHTAPTRGAYGLASLNDAIDATGSFRVSVPVAEGRYRLVATHPNYASVSQDFDLPLAGPPPVLRFTDRREAEVTVRLVTEPGSTLTVGVVSFQALPPGSASAPLAATYGTPSGARLSAGTAAPSSAFQARFPNRAEPVTAFVMGSGDAITRRVPAGPLWIGAVGRFEEQSQRGVTATGAVRVPKGASEVTLRLSPPLPVRGQLSAELLAKGSDPYLTVRPAGASTDLDVGRGPLKSASPFVRVDRQGRFDFAVPKGAYECRVHSAAGTLLKTVKIQSPQPEGGSLVIE